LLTSIKGGIGSIRLEHCWQRIIKMHAGVSAGCCHAADCDQCFMLHVCMQGNSTASANAVSMALSQGAPSTAISQAVAQVVRSSPLLICLLLMMDCLNSKSQLSSLVLTKLLSCRLAAVLQHLRYFSCGTAPCLEYITI